MERVLFVDSGFKSFVVIIRDVIKLTPNLKSFLENTMFGGVKPLYIFFLIDLTASWRKESGYPVIRNFNLR